MKACILHVSGKDVQKSAREKRHQWHRRHHIFASESLLLPPHPSGGASLVVCPCGPPKLMGLSPRNRGVFLGTSRGQGGTPRVVGPHMLLQVCPKPWDVEPANSSNTNCAVWQSKSVGPPQLCGMARQPPCLSNHTATWQHVSITWRLCSPHLFLPRWAQSKPPLAFPPGPRDIRHTLLHAHPHSIMTVYPA